MSNSTVLPQTGFVRLPSIIGPGGPIPVSKSTWWEGVKSGRYPQPVKLGPRITAWRVEDIRALIETGADADPQNGRGLGPEVARVSGASALDPRASETKTRSARLDPGRTRQQRGRGHRVSASRAPASTGVKEQ
jgi:prophage regulatory protein